MCWQPRHNTRQHALLPPRFLGIDAWLTSQMNVALIRSYVGHVIYGSMNNQALTDVRSTGAGIKCQHCILDTNRFPDTCKLYNTPLNPLSLTTAKAA